MSVSARSPRRGRASSAMSTATSCPGWYAAADALVLPSRSEPWGMPLNEGAAAGLPLLATDAVGAGVVPDRGRRQRLPAGRCNAKRCAVLCAELRRTSRSGEPPASGHASLWPVSRPKHWADSVVGLVQAMSPVNSPHG